MSKYDIIRGLILNHPNKDGTGTNRTDAIEPLSKIPNIATLLRRLYYKNNQKFKTIVDNRFTNVENLIRLVEDKEAENHLKQLVEEEKQADADAKKDTSSVEQVANAKAINLEDMGIDFVSSSLSFEAKLKEMEAKLPPKLGNAVSDVDYNTQVADKEFCYKFLYCWANNPDNKTNPNAIKVCNRIIDTYGIKDERFPKLDEKEDIQVFDDITFDVGFIINVNPPVQVITEKGGSTIPTQKRRPNKPQKRNHTIKDRVRVKTR